MEIISIETGFNVYIFTGGCMKTNKKVKEAAKKAMEELSDIPQQELEERLRKRQLGCIGRLMMDNPKTKVEPKTDGQKLVEFCDRVMGV